VTESEEINERLRLSYNAETRRSRTKALAPDLGQPLHRQEIVVVDEDWHGEWDGRDVD